MQCHRVAFTTVTCTRSGPIPRSSSARAAPTADQRPAKPAPSTIMRCMLPSWLGRGGGMAVAPSNRYHGPWRLAGECSAPSNRPPGETCGRSLAPREVEPFINVLCADTEIEFLDRHERDSKLAAQLQFAHYLLATSVREWPLREISGVLHDRERIVTVLDHLAPKLAGRCLMGVGIEGAPADRGIEGEPEQRLRYFVRIDVP